MPWEDDRFYKFSEIARATGIPQESLTRYARQGRLDAVKVGGHWSMLGSKVRQFLDSGTGSEAQEKKLDPVDIAKKLFRSEYDEAVRKGDRHGQRLYEKGLQAALLAWLGNTGIALDVVREFRRLNDDAADAEVTL